jgi:NTE family protein
MLILSGLIACTAHYPINEPITSTDALKRYTLQKEAGTVSSEELLFILTFSGGGTRAAALSYGVLRTLADTRVVVEGKPRRLLDEVDGISSVSGGSFTAAYYGLFGDRIFEDFEEKFLKHDVQSELTKRVLSPLSWPKLGSLYYDRSDLAADYYDQLLFENKTFQDIHILKGPKIAINATNLALGALIRYTNGRPKPCARDTSTSVVTNMQTY